MKKLYFLICAMPLLLSLAEEGHDNSLKTERPIAENLPINETLKSIEEKYKEMQEKDPLNIDRFLHDLHRIAHKFREEKMTGMHSNLDKQHEWITNRFLPETSDFKTLMKFFRLFPESSLKNHLKPIYIPKNYKEFGLDKLTKKSVKEYDKDASIINTFVYQMKYGRLILDLFYDFVNENPSYKPLLLEVFKNREDYYPGEITRLTLLEILTRDAKNPESLNKLLKKDVIKNLEELNKYGILDFPASYRLNDTILRELQHNRRAQLEKRSESINRRNYGDIALDKLEQPYWLNARELLSLLKDPKQLDSLGTRYLVELTQSPLKTNSFKDFFQGANRTELSSSQIKKLDELLKDIFPTNDMEELYPKFNEILKFNSKALNNSLAAHHTLFKSFLSFIENKDQNYENNNYENIKETLGPLSYRIPGVKNYILHPLKNPNVQNIASFLEESPEVVYSNLDINSLPSEQFLNSRLAKLSPHKIKEMRENLAKYEKDSPFYTLMENVLNKNSDTIHVLAREEQKTINEIQASVSTSRYNFLNKKPTVTNKEISDKIKMSASDSMATMISDEQRKLTAAKLGLLLSNYKNGEYFLVLHPKDYLKTKPNEKVILNLGKDLDSALIALELFAKSPTQKNIFTNGFHEVNISVNDNTNDFTGATILTAKPDNRRDGFYKLIESKMD